jgi:CO/xanthine dehydrogenase FAD-binding subunit
MPATDILTPATRDDLVAALSRATPRTRLLAGGTDLVRDIRRPGHEPDLLVDLTGLRGFAGVRLDGGTLRVGALTTFTDLQRDPLLRQHALCLALAAAQVGSVQIRNAGTVGGNIANASPCADSATALTALDAEVTTVDGAGVTLTRPIGEVLLGPNRTSLAHDQAIVEFAFPALGPEYRTAFTKIGSRTAVSVARLSAALVVRFDAASGTLADVRLALGAVGGVAFRATEVEALLEGRPADEESAHILADGCVAAICGSIPDRPSLPYKRHAAIGLAYDSWNALALCPPCEPAWG